MANQPSDRQSRGLTAAELALAVGSIAMALLACLAADWLYSKQQTGDPFALPQPKTHGRRLFITKPNGWYELNSHYNGEDRYGRYLIRVRTDERGFRIPIRAAQPSVRMPSRAGNRNNPTLLFLGDSFTYGVGASWEESFVGQVAARYRGTVLNAGVISHAPTAHRYRLARLLKDGRLPAGAVVIMAVDISDVQDEASRWVPGPGEPSERHSAAAAAVVTRQGAATAGRKEAQSWFSPQRFQLTHRIYYGLEALYKRVFDHWQVRNQARSAFTHQPWSALNREYQPLGVAGGLRQLRQQLQQAAALSARHGHPFWILIYPWPAQLAYEQRFQWEQFIQASCQPGLCEGVINAFPAFRQAVGTNTSSAAWQNRYYLSGDVHFTPAGNRLVAQTVLEALKRQ